VAVRRGEEKGIALADIKNRKFKLATRKLRRERMNYDQRDAKREYAG